MNWSADDLQKKEEERRAQEVRALIPTIKLLALDFDGVLTDNAVWVNERGEESVRCWRGDGIGLEQLRALGIYRLVISAEASGAVSSRCEKLQDVGALNNFAWDIPDKLTELTNWQSDLSTVAYIGNDVNDLECLKAVGLPIVTADAHPDVVPHAKYVTKAKGGFGAVREVCDLFCSILQTKSS